MAKAQGRDPTDLAACVLFRDPKIKCFVCCGCILMLFSVVTFLIWKFYFLKSIFTMTLCAQFDLDKYIQHNNTLNLILKITSRKKFVTNSLYKRNDITYTNLKEKNYA